MRLVRFRAPSHKLFVFASLAALAATSALSAVGCGSGDSEAAPPPFEPIRQGDLGPGGSPVIDHAGADKGVVGEVAQGPISATSWKPASCAVAVPVADGVKDIVWSEEVYGQLDPSPRAVHTSYAMGTDSSLAFVWLTDSETRASWVAVGDSPDKLDKFYQGVSFNYDDAIFDKTPPDKRVHEAHVCGLEPSHTYYFAVGGDGYWGKVMSTRTGPKVGSDDSFRIGVMGDSNNIFYDMFAKTVDALATAHPDIIVFTGDLVHDGTWATQWERWFAAAGDLIATTPTMAVHGNHEMNATGYFGQFALPGNEEYYSFDYGNAHFTVLNDTPKKDGPTTMEKEAEFLEKDLAAATSRAKPPTWLIVSHHRPAYSSGKSGPNQGVQKLWVPIYDKYHVNLVLNGHDHQYESSFPMRANKVQDSTADGTIYLVVGGAGAFLNPDKARTFNNPWSRTYEAAYSYVTVDVSPEKLRINAYRQDKTLIEPKEIVITH